MITIKTKEEIEILERGGKILSSVLDFVSKEVHPGVSTKYLEEIAKKKISELNASPAFLNYTPRGAKRAYPSALCISVNDEVVHGIPNEKPKILKKGDIVSIDCGVEFEGLFTDSAVTVPCGEIDKKGELLIKATKEALNESLKIIKPGVKTGKVGIIIEKIAKKYGFSPADDLGGHGVGYSQHEDPFIPNRNMGDYGPEFREGMVVAIEPMINEGKSKVRILSDGYTFVTVDGKRSAHFEHTIVINKKGAKIITK